LAWAIQAKAYLTRSIEMDTNNGFAWACLGKVHQLNDSVQARECFQQVLRINPHDAFALVQLSLIFRSFIVAINPL
jgi:Tfp pilus assembly protein PilF